MNRLSQFTDEEIYIIERAFIESAWTFAQGEKYNESESKLHEKLLNEFAKEDSNRIYKKEIVK